MALVNWKKKSSLISDFGFADHGSCQLEKEVVAHQRLWFCRSWLLSTGKRSRRSSATLVLPLMALVNWKKKSSLISDFGFAAHGSCQLEKEVVAHQRLWFCRSWLLSTGKRSRRS